VSDRWTIATLGAAMAAGRISPLEITRELLTRVGRLDGRVHSFITLDEERALQAARARTEELAGGRRPGPLHGIPLAYKDLCRIPGLPTSCGTRTRDYFVTDVECTAVRRLREAGAVTLGSLNMSELALGPFGDNAHHGDVDNPRRPGHCAGGSSSGSAAAVAAGFALGAVGSDTGGSIRLPAACCGVVGLKPTYGYVSRAGAMPLSWSLDHLGPLAGTVGDVALLLEAIAGHDPRDGTSSRRPAPRANAIESGAAGLRVGVPENYFVDGLAPEVEAGLAEAIRVVERVAAGVKTIRVPDPTTIVDASQVLVACESATIHARVLRERPHELQPVVRGRLEVGLHISAHDYLQAARLRAGAARAFIQEVFAEVDLLVAPTIPEPALAWAVAKAGSADDVIQRMRRFSRLTRPFNGLGLPALSLPCGTSPDGRPLALQIVGRPFDEVSVLRLGRACERETGWTESGPPIV